MNEPLHPQSMSELRALAKLHGVAKLQAALREIEQEIKVDRVGSLYRGKIVWAKESGK